MIQGPVNEITNDVPTTVLAVKEMMEVLMRHSLTMDRALFCISSLLTITVAAAGVQTDDEDAVDDLMRILRRQVLEFPHAAYKRLTESMAPIQ